MLDSITSKSIFCMLGISLFLGMYTILPANAEPNNLFQIQVSNGPLYVDEVIEFSAVKDLTVVDPEYSIMWYFGDPGGFDVGEIVEHKYKHPGFYEVTLKVQLEDGREFETIKTVQIKRTVDSFDFTIDPTKYTLWAGQSLTATVNHVIGEVEKNLPVSFECHSPVFGGLAPCDVIPEKTNVSGPLDLSIGTSSVLSPGVYPFAVTAEGYGIQKCQVFDLSLKNNPLAGIAMSPFEIKDLHASYLYEQKLKINSNVGKNKDGKTVSLNVTRPDNSTEYLQSITTRNGYFDSRILNEYSQNGSYKIEGAYDIATIPPYWFDVKETQIMPRLNPDHQTTTRDDNLILNLRDVLTNIPPGISDKICRDYLPPPPPSPMTGFETFQVEKRSYLISENVTQYVNIYGNISEKEILKRSQVMLTFEDPLYHSPEPILIPVLPSGEFGTSLPLEITSLPGTYRIKATYGSHETNEERFDVKFNHDAVYADKTITYKVFVGEGPKHDESFYKGIIRDALDYWEEQIPVIRFEIVSFVHQADFYIQWTNENEQCKLGYVGRDNIDKPYVAITAVDFKDEKRDCKWAEENNRSNSAKLIKMNNKNNLLKIAKHEIGHMIGLHHVSDVDDIMHYPINLKDEMTTTITLEEELITKTKFVALITNEQLAKKTIELLADKRFSLQEKNDLYDNLPNQLKHEISELIESQSRFLR